MNFSTQAVRPARQIPSAQLGILKWYGCLVTDVYFAIKEMSPHNVLNRTGDLSFGTWFLLIELIAWEAIRQPRSLYVRCFLPALVLMSAAACTGRIDYQHYLTCVLRHLYGVVSMDRYSKP